MEIVVSESFFPLLDWKGRYLCMKGGGGSGKTEFAARKLFKRSVEEGGHRFLVMRKVRKTLKDSVIKVSTTLLDQNAIRYEYNISDRRIVFYNRAGRRNEWLFEGLDDREKIKSIKGITGEWLEEATEFTKDDFHQLDLRLREPTKRYKQIMLTYNPDEARAKWLKDLEESKAADGNYLFHKSTVEDNPIPQVREEYRKVLDALDDPTFFNIYRLGEWAIMRGRIFTWETADAPPDAPDEIIYGGDFGFSVSPAAFVRVYRKGLDFWLEELVYETGLTNPMLAKTVMALAPDSAKAPSYWDSAEPKSIQELYDRGLNAQPCQKFPGSVSAMVKLALGLKIHVVRGSTNLAEEARKYKVKEDKDGRPISNAYGPVPVDFDNHAIMASLYAISTHYWKHLRPGVRRGRVVHSGMPPAVQPEEQEQPQAAAPQQCGVLVTASDERLAASVARMRKPAADEDDLPGRPQPAVQPTQQTGGAYGRARKGRVWHAGR